MAEIHSLAPEGGALAERCRAEMEAAGLSAARAAREVGVSSATLSTWLRGAYKGDSANVARRVEAWIETRREAARRSLAPAGLDRHVDLGVTGDVEAALGHAQATGDIALVHGRPGAGKTWAARRYCASRAGTAYVAVTGATTSLAGMLFRVAEAAGAGGQHPSALAAETAIVARLEGRTALLVVDEAHHLNARQLDELRCLRDLAGCGLGLLGDDSIRQTLARCPQVTGRTGVRVALGAAPEADVAALAQSVLGRRPAREERAALMAAGRGPGGLHALRRLLAGAWLMARADGRGAIAAGDLAAAAESEAA